MVRRVSLRWPEKAIIILGLLLIGLWAKSGTEARTFPYEARRLEALSLSARPAHPPDERSSRAPWCPAKLDIGVFGRIVIPRLGISALIAEGARSAQLDRSVGHIPTTVFPGRPGNCALAGHRDTFLRGLGDVRENDVVLIDTLQDTYIYVVEWGAVVGPHGVDVLGSTAMPSLTLVTCYPCDDVGPALERFVVRAKLVELAAGAVH